MSNDFVIPSSPEDRKRIQAAIKEMDDHLTIIDGAKDAIKDIREFLKDEFEMPPAVSNRLANTLHKQDFKDQEAKFEDFATAYEILVKGKTNES